MEYQITSGQAHKQRSNCIVIGVFEDRKLPRETAQLDQAAGGSLSRLLKRSDLTGKLGQSLLLLDLPGVTADRVLLVGCGREKDLDTRQYHKLMGHLAEVLKPFQCPEIISYLSLLPIKGRSVYWQVRFCIEALDHHFYQFKGYQSQPVESLKIKRLVVAIPSRAALKTAEAALAHAKASVEASRFSRDLGNMPGNIATPTYMAEQTKAFNTLPKVKVEVLDQAKMTELNMNAILAVARGSSEAPFLASAIYQGGKASDRPIVLVGKGITFDTGGVALKTWPAMHPMNLS